jgi:hypothetical protein
LVVEAWGRAGCYHGGRVRLAPCSYAAPALLCSRCSSRHGILRAHAACCL